MSEHPQGKASSSGSVIMQPWGWGKGGGAYGKQRTQAPGQAPMVSPTFVNMGWDDDDER